MFQPICKPRDGFFASFLRACINFQPWRPATNLLRTIQSQGFPQRIFSIQQLLSTEVHTCGFVDLVPLQHCRPCAARKKARFAYRLFGQRHTAKKLFYSTQKLLSNKNVAGDNQESMMLMAVTRNSQPYRRGSLALKQHVLYLTLQTTCDSSDLLGLASGHSRL